MGDTDVYRLAADLFFAQFDAISSATQSLNAIKALALAARWEPNANRHPLSTTASSLAVVDGGDEMHAHMFSLCTKHLFPIMASTFDLPVVSLFLYDAHVVRYDGDGQGVRGIGVHTHDSILSFNVLLSQPLEFRGGGTWTKSLNSVWQPVAAGGAILHRGSMRHGGYPIRRGQRLLLVGHVDVVDHTRKLVFRLKGHYRQQPRVTHGQRPSKMRRHTVADLGWLRAALDSPSGGTDARPGGWARNLTELMGNLHGLAAWRQPLQRNTKAYRDRIHGRRDHRKTLGNKLDGVTPEQKEEYEVDAQPRI